MALVVLNCLTVLDYVLLWSWSRLAWPFNLTLVYRRDGHISILVCLMLLFFIESS